MNPRIGRQRNQIISRCQRMGLHTRDIAATDAETGSTRLKKLFFSMEGKRKQMVERLLDRTLSSYLEPRDLASTDEEAPEDSDSR